MSDELPPVGRRFSQVYLRPDALLPESKRARRRMGHVVAHYMDRDTFGVVLAKKLGIPVPSNYRYGDYWPSIMEKLELRDFLDTITVLYQTLDNKFQPERSRVTRERLLQEAREIFEEEQIAYQIDDQGGVHLKIDAAFEGERASLISGLGDARYNNVRSNLDATFRALDETPPDYKGAVRAIFSAAEGLFKLIFSKPLQMNTAEIQARLKPAIDRIYADNTPALRSSHKQVESLRDWVDGAHVYRHESGTEEPSPPPAETAVLIVSQGMAFIRWLVAIDRLLMPQPLPSPEGTS